MIASSYKLGRGINFWFEKNAVEKRLEVTIASSSKKVNAEGTSLLPHGVDIKWADPKDRDAFLKDGKIIVCLESSYNEGKNLARATMLYVNEDLIRESQHFLDTVVMKAAKLTMSKKMLIADRKIDALRCFNEEFLEPEASKTPKIGEYVLAMEKMDEHGHFTRILLREFSQLGTKLSPRLTDAQAIEETKTFTDFMRVFEQRAKEEDVPLNHAGKVIRSNLLPVARSGVFPNPAPYVNRVSQFFTEEIGTVYVLARGGDNIRFAELVVAEIEKKKIYEKQETLKFKIPADSVYRSAVESYVAVLSRIG